jgi:hypothetical protein
VALAAAIVVGWAPVAFAWSLSPILLVASSIGPAAALTSQTITFPSLANRPYGTPPFTISATASSGLPVSFASTTRSVCTVGGNVVTLVALGTCTIQASQAGDANYAAAPKVSRSFSVTRGTQTIAFPHPPDQALVAGMTVVNATASSGLAVTFASLSTAVCTVSGNKVTLIALGTCTLKATQAGNAYYYPAPSVSRSFAVGRASQTIAFGPLADRAIGASPVALVATASSGLPVSLASLTPAVCTVSGGQATLAAAGLCTIRASQAGNGFYLPAPDVDRGFAVTAVTTIRFTYDAAGNVVRLQRVAGP